MEGAREEQEKPPATRSRREREARGAETERPPPKYVGPDRRFEALDAHRILSSCVESEPRQHF